MYFEVYIHVYFVHVFPLSPPCIHCNLLEVAKNINFFHYDHGSTPSYLFVQVTLKTIKTEAAL